MIVKYVIGAYFVNFLQNHAYNMIFSLNLMTEKSPIKPLNYLLSQGSMIIIHTMICHFTYNNTSIGFKYHPDIMTLFHKKTEGKRFTQDFIRISRKIYLRSLPIRNAGISLLFLQNEFL